LISAGIPYLDDVTTGAPTEDELVVVEEEVEEEASLWNEMDGGIRVLLIQENLRRVHNIDKVEEHSERADAKGINIQPLHLDESSLGRRNELDEPR
jgi:hypothetical protein